MVQANPQKKKKGGCCGGGFDGRDDGEGRKKPNHDGSGQLMMNIPEEEEIKQSKIIFMGDQYVGKTSIINTFMEGKAQKAPY